MLLRRLNKDWCVDATRAGNMAHLLNHSCEPNCLSRTISARHPSTGHIADHVVIFAKVRVAIFDVVIFAKVRAVIFDVVIPPGQAPQTIRPGSHSFSWAG